MQLNPYRHEFDPASLANLVWRVDAGTITGKNDGDAVSQWDDLVGTAHATQGTGANQPLYKVNIHNGRPAVRFDGSNDLLAANGVATYFSGNVAWTIFIVAKYVALSTNAIVGVGRSSDANPITLFNTLNNHYNVNHRATGTSVNHETLVTGTDIGIISCKRSGASGVMSANSSEVALTGVSTTVDRFTLGALVRNTTGSWANVDIFEVLVYSRALTDSEMAKVNTWLGKKYNVGLSLADSTRTDLALHNDGITDTAIATAAEITNATELREQDEVIYDPLDPNLGTNPERRYKFYYSAVVSGNNRVYVKFSENGREWGSPNSCTMGGSNRVSEDPSVMTLWNTRGRVFRDGSNKMYLYCEDSTTNTIYVYESTDGLTWTEMSGNPVIGKGGSGSWEQFLVGSPNARHDGTNFIVGYEGIAGSGTPGEECFGVASGTSANSLTKSSNNPVWDPSVDGHPTTSIVVDSMFKNDAGDKVVLFAHSGVVDTPTHWRGVTTVTDPTAWVSGDITTVGGNLSTIRNDLTLEHSGNGYTTVITGAADDQSLVRYRLWGAL